MWGDFFSSRSYSGSNLERLIRGRAAEIKGMTAESTQEFAQALQRERPQLFGQTVDSDGRTTQALDQQARDKLASGMAERMQALIMSSAIMAEYYGTQIDQLKASSCVAAVVLSTPLVAWVDACNIPFASSEGGYRRYFSGYVILHKSMRLFGFLEPWEKFIAGKKDSCGEIAPSFGEGPVDAQAELLPAAEQELIGRVLQGFAQFKSGIGLIPDPVASMTLNIALDNPTQLMSSGQWSGTSGAPRPGIGTCTFCGGTGLRSSCGGCNGKGHISRLGSGGQVEITTCLVCGGSGRARCDACFGTGKR